MSKITITKTAAFGSGAKVTIHLSYNDWEEDNLGSGNVRRVDLSFPGLNIHDCLPIPTTMGQSRWGERYPVIPLLQMRDAINEALDYLCVLGLWDGEEDDVENAGD